MRIAAQQPLAISLNLTFFVIEMGMVTRAPRWAERLGVFSSLLRPLAVLANASWMGALIMMLINDQSTLMQPSMNKVKRKMELVLTEPREERDGDMGAPGKKCQTARNKKQSSRKEKPLLWGIICQKIWERKTWNFIPGSKIQSLHNLLLNPFLVLCLEVKRLASWSSNFVFLGELGPCFPFQPSPHHCRQTNSFNI